MQSTRLTCCHLPRVRKISDPVWNWLGMQYYWHVNALNRKTFQTLFPGVQLQPWNLILQNVDKSYVKPVGKKVFLLIEDKEKQKNRKIELCSADSGTQVQDQVERNQKTCLYVYRWQMVKEALILIQHMVKSRHIHWKIDLWCQNSYFYMYILLYWGNSAYMYSIKPLNGKIITKDQWMS